MNVISLTNPPLINLEKPLALPGEGELHLWRWRFDAIRAESMQLDWLDAKERSRYERFANDELRQAFLAAHAGLRRLLGAYLKCPPNEIGFEFVPHGKPEVIGCPLRFNLSHSGGMVVLAVSGRSVGIDVEQIRPVTSLQSLAGKHMTAAEQLAIAGAQGDEQAALFLRLWTRKEAVVKLTGLGLQAAVNGLDVSVAEKFAGEVDLPTAWQTELEYCWLANIAMPNGYDAAVACQNAPTTIQVAQVSP